MMQERHEPSLFPDTESQNSLQALPRNFRGTGNFYSILYIIYQFCTSCMRCLPAKLHRNVIFSRYAVKKKTPSSATSSTYLGFYFFHKIRSTTSILQLSARFFPAVFPHWDEWFYLFPQPRKASQECTIRNPATNDQNIPFPVFPSEKGTAECESHRLRLEKRNCLGVMER